MYLRINMFKNDVLYVFQYKFVMHRKEEKFEINAQKTMIFSDKIGLKLP
jgi:hypothetical protein